MSTAVPTKRKIIFWRPQIKKRKISTLKWFKNSKTTPRKPKPSSNPHKAPNIETNAKSHNHNYNPIAKAYKAPNITSNDNNDTFEIVKISKPANFNSYKAKAGTSPIAPPLKIKLATPSKQKHSEYNLKSLILQNTESPNAATTEFKHEYECQSNINITTRSAILSTSPWHKLGDINPHLLNHIKSFMQLSQPTMIQTKCIPHLLSHNDVLIKSETGSGKTLAYLIPIISELTTQRIVRGDGCQAMIIAPTRELTLQIHTVSNVLCRYTPFVVIGHLMGGEDKKKEKAKIRKGLTVVIGTPGRILDHFENTRAFKFDLLKWFVLDEADILLILGFAKFIKSIVRIIQQNSNVPQRCNVLVSATLDDKIQKLADFVLNKQHILVGTDTYIPHSLKHHYVCVKREYKSVAFIGLLRMLYTEKAKKWKSFKIVVFMSTCAVIHYYFELLRACKLFPGGEAVLPADIKYFELRGDMTQKERTRSFFAFCNVRNGILFCTDVASRGLDIPFVNVIVQYDPPAKLKDYIHRSGRTARMGKAGQTVLFLCGKEMRYLDILKKNKFKFEQVPIGHIWNQLDVDYKRHNEKEKKDGFDFDAKKSMLAMNIDGENGFLSSRNVIIDHLKGYVMRNEELLWKGKDAMQTFIKAYTTYPRELKSIFFIQNLDFYQCSKCFFIEREGRFLKKGGMRKQIQQNRYSKQKEEMRDVAQKITKKRNVPSAMSEFAAM